MTPAEVLRAARAILTPETWIQGTAARDELNHAVYPRDPDAKKWDAPGAIFAVSRGHVVAEIAALDAFRAAIGTNRAPSAWNDDPDRTLAEVLAAFDVAIAETEKR